MKWKLGMTSRNDESDDLFLSSQLFEIVIFGTAVSFVCVRDEYILNAMKSIGVRGIPSGCHGGGCGVCKIKIISGSAETENMSREKVSLEEEGRGICLACRARPLSDMLIEPLEKLEKPILRQYGFM